MSCDPVRLENIIRGSGLSFKTNPKSFIFTCPLCRKANKLYIRKSDGVFSCWVCKTDKGFCGNAEYALRELLGRPIQDIKLDLYGAESVVANTTKYLDINLASFFDEDENDEDLFEIVQESPDAELEETVWPHDALSIGAKQSRPGADYLEKRGIPLDLALEYQIRYQPNTRTVLFPVYSGERLIGWQHRIIDSEWQLRGGKVVKVLKTWSSVNIPREQIVMFAHRISGYAVLCEGPMDALHAHLAGGNVASMGKSVSDGQIQMLLRTGIERLYLGLDPDAAGELEPILEKVGRIPTFQIEVPRPYKDLGEVPLEAVPDLVAGAHRLEFGRIHTFFKGQDKLLKTEPRVKVVIDG